MKKSFYFLFLCFLSLSCSSYYNFNSFYNYHKNEPNVKSFQVPRYLKSIVKNSSPELNSLVKNITDFKTISFTECSPQQSELIIAQINGITRNYTDVARNNTPGDRYLVAVKEKGDQITSIIIHSAKSNNQKIIYLKGHFNPNRIKELSNNQKFEGLLEE